MKSWYDEKEDVLNIQFKKYNYWKSVELPNGIVFDIAKDGTIVSIEVLHASKVFLGPNKKVIDVAKKAQ
jgi:uncharacterized protein YuzE